MPNIIKNVGSLNAENAVLIPGNLPKVRIIHADNPEEDLSGPTKEELAIEAARAELESIQAEGEETIRQAQRERNVMLAQSLQEAEQIREQARQEGFASAQAEKRGAIEASIRQVDLLLGELQASMEEFQESYEKELANLSIEITEKVIEARISENDLTLTELVKRAVSGIKKADWIKVEVSDQLAGLVELLREELNTPGMDVEVEGKKGVSAGSCVIQTPDGTIDASVSTQLENLRETLQEIDNE